MQENQRCSFKQRRTRQVCSQKEGVHSAFIVQKRLFLFGIKFADAVLLSALIVLNYIRLPLVKVECTKKSFFFYRGGVIFNWNI